MKKLVLILVSALFVLTLSACDDLCVGPECITGEVDDNPDDNDNDGGDNGGTAVDNVLPFTHINGHGEETEKNAFILYEFEVRDYVKYQVTYISCTCRDAVYNYWQVAFIEVNKYTNDVLYISFDLDGDDGHYTPGTWGDSSPTPAGKTYEDFATDFFPWLEGKSLADLEGISVFTNDDYHGVQNTANIAEQDLIDDFAGSSVSTNNLIRIIKELLEYHEAKYN
jgi:hypothetical protein